MIQDIAPKIFYNEYTPEPPAWEDPVFIFRGREVLLGRREDGALCCPEAGEFSEEDLQYLFRIDGRKYYLYREDFPEDYGREARSRKNRRRIQIHFLPGWRSWAMTAAR